MRLNRIARASVSQQEAHRLPLRTRAFLLIVCLLDAGVTCLTPEVVSALPSARVWHECLLVSLGVCSHPQAQRACYLRVLFVCLSISFPITTFGSSHLR